MPTSTSSGFERTARPTGQNSLNLLLWITLSLFTICFAVGLIATYVGLENNSHYELCATIRGEAGSEAVNGSCKILWGATSAHFLTCFLYVAVPLMGPILIAWGVIAVGRLARLRLLREGAWR